MSNDALITAMVTAEIARAPIRSQEDCCRIAAVVACRLESRPWTYGVILDVAASLANGLFGPAFHAADYGQRCVWIDMCEQELRAEIVRQGLLPDTW